MKSPFLILIFLILLLAKNLSAQTRFSNGIQHVEPKNWWLGLKSNKLQLMVHGRAIAGAKVSSTNPGWKLLKVHSSSNPNYIFLDFEILPIAKAGLFKIEISNSAGKQMIDYELKAKSTIPPGAKGFDQSDVMYLIMPDRFANGNPNNDNVEGYREKANRSEPSGRHGGDLEGIEKHLDYIKDLGFTTLWINPIIENNQVKTSYHGYSFTDLYQIDARFGSLEDYKRLILRCHENGMKMVQDMVANHIGTNHWWMDDLPMADWVHPAGNPLVKTNFKMETVVDPNKDKKELDIFEKGWFDVTMPDLNQSNPFISKYLIQNTLWWICETGIDGIRMDTYPYNDLEFMSRWCREVKAEFPQFGLVGEVWVDVPAICSYFAEGAMNRDGYKAALPSVTDFPVYNAIAKALVEKDGWDTGLSRLYITLAQDFLYKDPSRNLIFLDNHDLTRFLTYQKGDLARLRQGIAMLLTLRGIPQFYYGSEILMSGDGAHHPEVRKDFPGGWPGDTLNLFDARNRNGKIDSMHRFCRNLLQWRKTSKAISKGKFQHLIPEKNVYTYFRIAEKEMVMVVVNGNEKETNFALSKVSDYTKGWTSQPVSDVLSQSTADMDTETIKIPGKGVLILEFRK
jgi:glycosidase